ncbi:putative esterase [Sphingobium sp. SYK-6]|uniref:alpha/beta hydrolase n=1 Tax=Sphingobium sp. (strain NBRC 103272 / SYK-6) TaxID=627192 RepID=UPI000227676E|nr:alpha/beta fold hydrolase [Sphingobium sp. SYK-6]BAK65233.1 putative esterase [Sphingobium sp. SYK-6]
MRFPGWMRRLGEGLAALGLAMAVPATAQVSVEKVRVHSPAIAGNLEGNSAEREVIVVLPSGYARDTNRRYPVVYFLHGFMATAAKYDGFIGFAEALGDRDMILVVPDSYTKHGGAMYSSSSTVGDFESFIARDLVAYIDGHYRTIARREGRGLSGHSMGGYGTLKIGMKYPGVFSSLYAMSSCCLSARGITPERGKQLEAMDMAQALEGDFGVRADFAAAAAWSPAPDKPPFFLDLGTKDGVVQPGVLAQWAANAPHALVPQYLPALRSMKAIAMDVGDKDFLLADNQEMTRLLTRFGVPHSYSIYDGDHGNRVAERFRTFVLPFFAEHLATQ